MIPPLSINAQTKKLLSFLSAKWPRNPELLKLQHEHSQLSGSTAAWRGGHLPGHGFFLLPRSLNNCNFCLFSPMFVHSPSPFAVRVICHVRIEPSVLLMTSSARVKATPCTLGQFGGGAASILCWMEGAAPLTPPAEAQSALEHAGVAQWDAEQQVQDNTPAAKIQRWMQCLRSYQIPFKCEFVCEMLGLRQFY